MGKRQLRLEGLEGRTMLAGDVSAYVSSGDLVVEGDGSNEAVAIILKSNGIKVKGLDGSTINGQGKLFFNNVHDDIHVEHYDHSF